MSKFSEMARLKELALELAELKGMRFLPTAEIDRMGEIEEEICCSADMLLKIAEAFQPGDGKRLSEIPCLLQHEDCEKCTLTATCEMLVRLQAAAEEIER